jgi:hypothetical protein
MAAFVMTMEQLTFPNPSFADDHGNPVPLSSLTLAFDSADPTIVAFEKRADNGAADPNGQDAAVAQGPLGTTQVHCTATNADGTTVVLTGDIQIVAADAVTGTMNFGAAVNKA